MVSYVGGRLYTFVRPLPCHLLFILTLSILPHPYAPLLAHVPRSPVAFASIHPASASGCPPCCSYILRRPFICTPGLFIHTSEHLWSVRMTWRLCTSEGTLLGPLASLWPFATSQCLPDVLPWLRVPVLVCMWRRGWVAGCSGGMG